MSESLLRALLAPTIDSETRKPVLGHLRFDHAEILGDAGFDRVTVRGKVSFRHTKVRGNVRFVRAEIGGSAEFNDARIEGSAFFGHTKIGSVLSGMPSSVNRRSVSFNGAEIRSVVGFAHAEISGDVVFVRAKIGGELQFNGAEIGGNVLFRYTAIGWGATFRGAVFRSATEVGTLVCKDAVDLSEATFESGVTIEASARAVICRRTRWASTATLRLRFAKVDLSNAFMEYPVSVSAHPRPFARGGGEMAEPEVPGPLVWVTSLRGVDAAHLVLADVDLSRCRFAGAIHLDQLRMEGRCPFAAVPSGIHRRGLWPVRWTPRRILAEEQHWRAHTTSAAGWTPSQSGEPPEPAALAPIYRQLRKAFEDSKDEPGAADFYYGEMEMRRLNRDAPRAERALLAAYWAASGYGLRASRAMGLLLVSMTTTVLVMMLWGLPKDDPKPESTGTLNGPRITITTDTPDPVNPDGPLLKRLSTDRFEKSLRVVINSVVFRSSGQDLTTGGTYIEMGSRLAVPALLGLAVLAVRGRLKR